MVSTLNNHCYSGLTFFCKERHLEIFAYGVSLRFNKIGRGYSWVPLFTVDPYSVGILIIQYIFHLSKSTLADWLLDSVEGWGSTGLFAEFWPAGSITSFIWPLLTIFWLTRSTNTPLHSSSIIWIEWNVPLYTSSFKMMHDIVNLEEELIPFLQHILVRLSDSALQFCLSSRELHWPRMLQKVS